MLGKIASLILFLIPILSNAITLKKSIPFKQTSCHLGKTKAELFLRFEKKMDSATNDFSGAPLVFLKSKIESTLESTLKSSEGDFNFIPPKIKSNCKDTLALPIGKTTLAIFYSSDNRPFQENYRVVLWNAKTDKITDQRDLGAVSAILPTTEGFSYSNLIPRSDVDQIDMKSTSGKAMIATDKDLNALKSAKIVNKKLYVEFDPHLSFEKSQWKKFFKDKLDYLNATGWDGKQKRFANVVVYEASHFNGKDNKNQETCIDLTNKRGGSLVEPKWRCIQELRK